MAQNSSPEAAGQPLVSFIVPVYKVAAYLPACVDSILAQQGASFEVILVDDGSPDESGQICDDYAEKDARVRVIHQENAGVSAARNAGLDAAIGQWLCFVDGDDWIAPDFLARFTLWFGSASAQSAQICFVRHIECPDGKIPPATAAEQNAMLDEEDFQWLLRGGLNRDLKGRRDYWKIKPATPCKMYLRDVVLQAKAQFPIALRTGEDLLFNLQLYRVTRLGAYLPGLRYYHRVWANSVSQGYDPHALEAYTLLQQRLAEFFASLPGDYTDDLANRAVLSLGFCCMLQFCHPDNPAPYRRRRRAFLQAAGSEPFRTALQRAPAGAFRIQKRVLLFFMKHRCFSAVSLLCWAQRKR